MPDLLAGTTVKALDTPVTVADVQSASFDTTSTTYGTSSSGGSYADCGVTFTAPTTGRVKIHIAARMITSTSTNGTLLCAEVREGATIGSGTIVSGTADGKGISHYGDTFERQGACNLVTGLTPGDVYNARILHRVSTSGPTGTIALRELIVEPAT